MATKASELRDKVVAKAKSREKKNQYTQGEKRTQVGSGWSDCSSFVRWCYLQVLKQDIGSNTVAQVNNKKLIVVDTSSTNASTKDTSTKDTSTNGTATKTTSVKPYPDEKKLLPGDLIYYKGTDKSRPYMVGHVEMYIGSGKLIGHGSGTGPTIKSMTTYSNTRAKSGKGYIRTLRVIPDAAQGIPDTTQVNANDGAGGQAVAPANPMQSTPAETQPTPAQPDNAIRITGNTVNLRTGPGTEFPVVKTAKAGQLYPRVDTDNWHPILVSGKICWVSKRMSEKV